MNLRIINKDLFDVTPRNIRSESVDVIVTSPPYKRADGYSPDLMAILGELAARVLRPGGRLFLNFGQLREGIMRPYDAARVVSGWGNLTVTQTVAWIKSFAFDGAQRGHYQPINSDKVLNYAWEPVFIMVKPPDGGLDRLAIGVPFTDKSNMKRGGRGRHGDLHCAGDVWFIPHETTGPKTKKGHAHAFPLELALRCIKVAGISRGSTVLDPFLGSGTTACAAKLLGMKAIGVERNAEAAEVAKQRHKATKR